MTNPFWEPRKDAQTFTRDQMSKIIKEITQKSGGELPEEILLPEEVYVAAQAISSLRSCSLEWNQTFVCASCLNAPGYNDDVGCITLAIAVLEAIADGSP